VLASSPCGPVPETGKHRHHAEREGSGLGSGCWVASSTLGEQGQSGVHLEGRTPGDAQGSRPVRALSAKGFRKVQHGACAGSLRLISKPGVTARRPSNHGDHEPIQLHRHAVRVQAFVIEQRR
jgi:hypothetical protein